MGSSDNYLGILANNDSVMQQAETAAYAFIDYLEIERNPQKKDDGLNMAYTVLMNNSVMTKQWDKADEAYKLWCTTEASKDQLLKYNQLTYLLENDRKEYVLKGIELAKKGVTECLPYCIPAFQQQFWKSLADAYIRVGDYKAACSAMEEVLHVNDELTKTNIEDEGQKWAKKFELQEKEFEIEKKTSENKLAWTIAGFLLFILIGMSAGLVVYRIIARRTKEKNKLLVKQIDQIETYRKELKAVRLSAHHRQDAKFTADLISDKELEEKLENATEGKELFRNPKLTIEDMAKELDVSVPRLKTLFEHNPELKRLEDYLFTKRVVYACKVLRTQPGRSMQEVADLSGFTNIKAFNRQFKKYVSMTPSEYKQATE